ncbi:MAG TPA: hypothetical protein VFV47_04800 [Hyphomicrobiaceae bacterium]|nr:hypothetical protein [Hyphomicrobiaceae bacterium]
MQTAFLVKILSALIVLVPTDPIAAEPIESIGAERCGGPVQRHEVEFLAPEATQVIVVAKVLRDGKTDATAASISIDGKPCTGAGCGFRAEKGRTYRLLAETTAQGFDDLCISVGRP